MLKIRVWRAIPKMKIPFEILLPLDCTILAKLSLKLQIIIKVKHQISKALARLLGWI